MKHTQLSLIALVATLITSGTASANLIAYDPFKNAAVANGANDKANGQYNAGSTFRDFTNGNNDDVASGPIVGFSSGNLWEGNSGSPSNTRIIGPTNTTGLTFGSNIVQGGSAQARGFNTTTTNFARRSLDSYTGSNTYYMSGLIRGENLGANLNVKSMMGFTNSIASNAFDGTEHFGALFGFSGNGSQVDLVARHRNASGPMTESLLLANVSSDTTYFVTLKLEFDFSGSDDRISGWVNESTATEGAAGAADFSVLGEVLGTQTSMVRAGFYVENYDSDTNDWLQFDELRLGTTWADAVAVPEPGFAAAWMAIMAGGFLALRRRRTS